MTPIEHDDITRGSFSQQVPLFRGEDSPFALRAASTLGWVEPLDTTMHVLDVACGAGHLAEQIAPEVREYVGIDLTRELLELGATRVGELGLENVLLQEGKAESLPFVDASFDLVVCRSSLHHFQDPERAVAEMARVCRPGGRVVLLDMVPPLAAARDAFDDLHRRLDPSHVRVLLEAELTEVLRAHVGPVSDAARLEPISLPIDLILTDVADRDAVSRALEAELAGGPPTGFSPVPDGDQILVSFTSAVVHATRERPAATPGSG